MGIPRFFRYITEEYPEVSKHISFKSGFNQEIDNLYLDANGILHNCARDVYFPEKMENKHKKENRYRREVRLFERICEYMDQLLKFVKPKNIFYIAIDGTAPLSKQAQQRQRRYRSADQKSKEELEIFDSTAITPGTNFMCKLSKYIRYYIRKKLMCDQDWQNIKIIFSGPDVVGEGEHKIVDYIRKQKNKDSLIHCMYGLDADLFMLSLSTHCKNFYLLREDQFTVSWSDTFFYKVDIGKLRQEIADNWGNGIGSDSISIINDFVFVCFLVGNDFLHALPDCHDLGDSINFIMDVRKAVLGDRYITGNSKGGYNTANLTELFKELEKTEAQAISVQYYKQNFENRTLNASLKNPNHPDQGIDLSKYREFYYKKIGIDHNDKSKVYAFCKSYLEGLDWVYHYYNNWAKNWQWYFPYHYSPLIIDLVDYLTNKKNKIKLERVSNIYIPPILPFQQLLCVVPPKSKNLLPSFLQNLYHNELKEYYPEHYNIDYEGKYKEWEGIAILPFVDIKDVENAYNSAVEKARKQKLKTQYTRNIPGKTILFELSNNQSYDYNSDYGEIKKCQVKFTLL